MATSSEVTAGTNATATQYNNLRTDAITRYVRFYFEIKGTLVTGTGQAKIVIPASMTVTKIKHKVVSGSATITVKSDSNTVKASIAVGTSYANETSGFSTTAIAEGEELTIDIDGVSSGDTLRVMVFATETI